MEPRRPMPDEDRALRDENHDLGRAEDLERARDRDDDAMPPEEERPETADERSEVTPEGRLGRPTIAPDDATPTEDPGISPI